MGIKIYETELGDQLSWTLEYSSFNIETPYLFLMKADCLN